MMMSLSEIFKKEKKTGLRNDMNLSLEVLHLRNLFDSILISKSVSHM